MMGDEHGYLMAEQTATASELPKYPSNVFSARFRSMDNRTSLIIRAAHDGKAFSHLCLITASHDVAFSRKGVPVELRYVQQGVLSRNIAMKHLWGQ